VGDQGGDIWCDAKIYVILDRWRDTSIYRSHILRRSMTKTTFSDSVQPYSPTTCQDATMSTIGMILVVTNTFLSKREC
jgi:hypothetical protein